MYNYNALFILLRYCLGVIFLYPIIYCSLYLNDKYRTLDYNKRCYIVKNLIKSAILLYITITSYSGILLPILKNTWINKDLNDLAAIYVSNDVIGLLIIPKLPATTKFHHITTTLLVLYSFSIDFTQETVGRWMFIYTFMSILSFGVNAYLGLRYLITDKPSFFNKMVNILRIMSFYIYLSCCLVNWGIHIYLIGNKVIYDYLSITYILYLIFLIPIIRDDIILMTWLYNKSR